MLLDYSTFELAKEIIEQYYAKKSAWTFYEAVALIIGFNPKEDFKKITPQFDLRSLPLTELFQSAIDAKEFDYRKNYKGEQIFKPLDVINWCKDKDILFSEKLKLLVRKYHHPRDQIDFEVENNKQREKIALLEEENTKLKKSLEQKFLHKTKEESYQQLLAMIGAGFNLLKDFNAYQISHRAENCNLNFTRLSEPTICALLKAPRQLLGMSETDVKSKNTKTK